MARAKVLLAGETWVTPATHIKGFDQFSTVTFHRGAEAFVAALADSPFELTYMPAHEAQSHFPSTLEGLRQYDVVVLSDIGANTLLLHPDTFIHSKPTPNRLKLLRDYVGAGHGLMMIGGYYSFQGINAGARYRGTPIEEVLPVEILPWDDRVEVPEGFRPEIVGPPDHPVLAGLDAEWPDAARAQRGQGKTIRRASGQGACRGGRPPVARARHLREGPRDRLDLRSRPALGAARLPVMARLRRPVAAMPGMAQGSGIAGAMVAVRGVAP